MPYIESLALGCGARLGLRRVFVAGRTPNLMALKSGHSEAQVHAVRAQPPASTALSSAKGSHMWLLPAVLNNLTSHPGAAL